MLRASGTPLRADVHLQGAPACVSCGMVRVLWNVTDDQVLFRVAKSCPVREPVSHRHWRCRPSFTACLPCIASILPMWMEMDWVGIGLAACRSVHGLGLLGCRDGGQGRSLGTGLLIVALGCGNAFERFGWSVDRSVQTYDCGIGFPSGAMVVGDAVHWSSIWEQRPGVPQSGGLHRGNC